MGGRGIAPTHMYFIGFSQKQVTRLCDKCLSESNLSSSGPYQGSLVGWWESEWGGAKRGACTVVWVGSLVGLRASSKDDLSDCREMPQSCLLKGPRGWYSPTNSSPSLVEGRLCCEQAPLAGVPSGRTHRGYEDQLINEFQH